MYCVMCGNYAPEGSQVCGKCYRENTGKNFPKIRIYERSSKK